MLYLKLPESQHKLYYIVDKASTKFVFIYSDPETFNGTDAYRIKSYKEDLDEIKKTLYLFR